MVRLFVLVRVPKVKQKHVIPRIFQIGHTSKRCPKSALGEDFLVKIPHWIFFLNQQRRKSPKISGSQLLNKTNSKSHKNQ